MHIRRPALPAAALLFAAPAAIAQCDLAYDQQIVTSPAQTSVARSAAADFDGDGRIDLAYVFNLPGSGLIVQWGQGDGSFGAPFEFDPAAGACIDAGDFNRDGRPDLAVAIPGGTRGFKILTSNGDRTFTTHPSVSFGPGPGFTSLDAADLDGDGNLDVVGVTATSGPGIAGFHLARGDGSGDLILGPSTTFTPPTLQVAVSVQAMHLDDRPAAKIVVTIGRANASTIYTAPFVAWDQAPVVADLRSLPITHHTAVVADLDADGFDDLVLGSNGPGGSGITVLPSFGSGSLRGEQHTVDDRGFPSAIAAADADGDGDVDIITLNSTFRVWLNDGHGTMTSTRFSFTAAGFGALSVADFNRDGRPDLAINGGANIAVILNAGPLASARPARDSILACGSSVMLVQLDGRDADGATPRWQYLGRDGWTPIDAGDIFTTPDGSRFGFGSGVDSSTLRVDLAPGCCSLSLSALVRCVVSNACGESTGGAVRLSACRPDFTCDGFLDFFDYDGFVDAYLAGGPNADFNADGFLDFFDYDDFVAAFETGC